MTADIQHSFCPSNQQEWRDWLKEHHETADFVWLIIYKKGSAQPNLTWSQAVDEALCFGWIDSLKKSIDAEKYMQYFCKRKHKSIWSKINKTKVVQLIKNDRMTEAGIRTVEIAKQNGSWSVLDEVDELIIPQDLENEFERRPGAKDFYHGLSKSVKKGLLYWIVSAKRPETRQNRILEIAKNAQHNLKPKQFR
ncbi:MAG: hypothetical protein ACI8ZN_002805 [Bacteroidia bacterium]|jgi:uncharacterized protein YdeI (YjbR/CyaY-like superfamily)